MRDDSHGARVGKALWDRVKFGSIYTIFKEIIQLNKKE